VITPRATRLVRTPNLQAFRMAVAALACDGAPLDARARLVLVPTRAASEHLRRSLERRMAASARTALILPGFVTSADLVPRLAERIPLDRDVLTDAEREVLLGVACRAAQAAGVAPPFQLRAGLVAEILKFYDALQAHQKDVDTFERLALMLLEPGAVDDRGAERLVRQTRFLVAAFREFERARAQAGLDVHDLRARLCEVPASAPVRHLIVTVGDRAFDPHGLSPADWDLIARVPGLERIDVVVTEAVLAGAHHEKLHQMLPGIEEVRAGDEGGAEAAAGAVAGAALSAAVAPSPVLLVPPTGELCHVARDREEEIGLFARHAKAALRRGDLTDLDRAALVVRQPLPYVYLTREVCRAAGVPCQMFDALPLAAEPYAAALDLVCAVVDTAFGRGPSVALLRSPHFRFTADDTGPSARDLQALDDALAEAGYLGERISLERLLDVWRASHDDTHGRAVVRARAVRAGEVLARLAAELEPLRTAAPVATHLTCLLDFLARYEHLPGPDDPLRARQLRARGAIVATLTSLRDAHALLDPQPVEFAHVTALVRRWIEAQTFAPRAGDAGVHLVDAASARYGDFDHVHLAGLVEGEWPDHARRSIFYSLGVLRELGWPAEAERIEGARAAFADLLTLPSTRLVVSTFQLEADALVTASPLLEVLETAALDAIEAPAPARRVFDHEALSLEPVDPSALVDTARGWAAIRITGRDHDDARYRGTTDAFQPGPLSLSALESYQDCPFKFFAGRVLRIGEPAEDRSELSAKAHGTFVHEVLHHFFAAWDARGGGPITAERLDDARALAVEVAEPLLAALPQSDAGLERTRVFGSAIALGIIDVVLHIEASRPPEELAGRWLEHKFEGAFSLAADSPPVALRGTIDRVDLLPGRRLRVVDYKTGSPPKPARALQAAVYALCAQELLSAQDGQPWTIEETAYLSFGRKPGSTDIFGGASRRANALDEARDRVFDILDGMRRGEFPPRPHEPRWCMYCAYSTICRKDYVGDE
jgi:RecB family exonuclease